MQVFTFMSVQRDRSGLQNFQAPPEKRPWRRNVQMQDESGIICVVTFWNGYATRSWTMGKTFLLIGAEVSLRRSQGSTPERQINVWYDAMVIQCEGEYEDFKLP